ncbi:MAG: hypothetical protein GX416_11730 [Bacteroidales bacterium]|nr:hypothetical protein [Bacteroidales bacterium]
MKKHSFFSLSLLIFMATCITSCSHDNDDTPLSSYAKVSSNNINLPCKGVIYSEYKSDEANLLNMIDNNKETSFSTDHNKFWIIWKAASKTTINHYRIMASADKSTTDPKSWTLCASDDSIHWDILDSESSILFENRSDYKDCKFQNEVSYIYYKLQFTENNGDSNTHIAEWWMGYGEDLENLNIDDLMSLATSFTASNDTPMGKYYAGKHITTSSDKEWLADPANEPDIPSDMSAFHLQGFKVTLYPYGTPTPADVNQHGIGDCCACAVFAELAYTHPDFLQSIIHQNSNGSFSVNMYDPQGKIITVTVSSTFLANSNNTIQSCSGKYNIADWASILEKAILKHQVIYQIDNTLNGIATERVMTLFTGNGASFSFTPSALNAQQMKRVVKWAMSKGKMIVGGFNQAVAIGDVKTVTAHAYSILLPYNETTELFCMRNPWGVLPYDDSTKGYENTQDGVMRIPLTGVQPLIDFRVMESGAAGNTAVKAPYTLPKFTANPLEIKNPNIPLHLLHKIHPYW